MCVLKTNLGYFQPVTSNMGLKELKWQQVPFSKKQLFNNSNKDVSRETLNQINLYLLGSLHFLKCRMGKQFLINNSLTIGATSEHLGRLAMPVNETQYPSSFLVIAF